MGSRFAVNALADVVGEGIGERHRDATIVLGDIRAVSDSLSSVGIRRPDELGDWPALQELEPATSEGHSVSCDRPKGRSAIKRSGNAQGRREVNGSRSDTRATLRSRRSALST